MQRVCVGAIAAMACAFASAASAQDYPSRPIHVVIGFAAGSGADILTRFYANKLAEVSGQSTVVENRPGAVGIIAATVVAKAKPDGYTVLFSGSTIMAGGHHLVKDFPFDPDKDLGPGRCVPGDTIRAGGQRKVWGELGRRVGDVAQIEDSQQIGLHQPDRTALDRAVQDENWN